MIVRAVAVAWIAGQEQDFSLGIGSLCGLKLRRRGDCHE